VEVQQDTHFSRGKEFFGFFVHNRIISAVKRAGFVSDSVSYIILRGFRCHILVLNVHAQTEHKTGAVKGGFYEELERIFNKFL
jgi:hypothetical protein